MPEVVDVEDAQRRFELLLGRVEAGEEIVIARDGEPVARLRPLPAGPSSPVSPPP